jgi:DNA repair ATPase RecN
MRKLSFPFFLFMLSTMNIYSQVDFKASEQYKVVYQDDTVTIHADTAFIVSKTLAGYFNRNVLDLQDLKQKYNNLIRDNQKLGKELEKALKLVDNLLKENTAGNEDVVSNLNAKIGELNAIILSLETVNKQLTGTNKNFEAEIKNLKKLNHDLKRLTRGIWWNGITDKLVAFGGGLVIGGTIMYLVK